MHLDATQLEFLARLGRSSEGQQLQVLLKARIADANEQLRKKSGESLIQEQGRANELDELVAYLNPPKRSTPPRDLSRASFQGPRD